MKLLPALLVILLAGCNNSPIPIATAEPIQEARVEKPQGCIIDTSTRLVNQRKVGNIINLTKEEVANGWENSCTVHFDLEVDGVMHHVDDSEKGLEQMASICYYAKKKGRENLLLDLGGEFKSEAKIECITKDHG
jgi:hypothetical protein